MGARGTATLDFTSTPSDSAAANVADASVTTGSYAEAFVQSGDSTADNGTDEHDMLSVLGRLRCKCNAGSIDITAELIGFLAIGTFAVRYVVDY